MRLTDEMITVGKISGTHGIRGHLRIHSYSGNLDSLRNCTTVTLARPGSHTHSTFTVQDVRPHKGGFIVKLGGFDNINQVEQLVGSDLLLQRNHLPETGDGEYYWCDLIGLTVETDTGRVLGTISDIFETGSSDIYVVSGTGREYLIPAVAHVISTVDLESGRMVITPLDGLLDL